MHRCTQFPNRMASVFPFPNTISVDAFVYFGIQIDVLYENFVSSTQFPFSMLLSAMLDYVYIEQCTITLYIYIHNECGTAADRLTMKIKRCLATTCCIARVAMASNSCVDGYKFIDDERQHTDHGTNIWQKERTSLINTFLRSKTALPWNSSVLYFVFIVFHSTCSCSRSTIAFST